ncbi:uncharacterized protein TNCT_162431 [Trichonephila clavata]|uniref:Bestrophin homolog n=1 Tax=Trichonephila clavata TaxID=2740835 RepID=A0A8X6JAS1_TRICU|nr:uncharacterized protein TNCT_162431 [Trichonephila clavata]
MILNPYGEDDDDFELNWCLDRSVHLTYLVVDNLQLKHPKVTKDFFWDEMEPILPQTRQSAKFFVHPQLGSAFNLEVEEAEYLPMDELLEQDAEENVYSGSIKRGNEYRPSLIRRLISSGFGQSRRRRTYRRENSSSSSGFTNAAFESNNEKNIVSNRKVPLGSPTSSLNNAVAVTASHSRTSSASFRPNSLSLQKSKAYDLHEAERKTHRLQAVKSAPEAPTDEKAIPVIKSLSAPLTNAIENSILPTEELSNEENYVEEDSNQTESDRILMPPIPEETSKAPSVVGVEDENVIINESPQKKLEEVQHLMNEANKVLKELNFSSSTEQRQDHESKCYESCCSANEDNSSDENVDFKDIKPSNVKGGDATVIEIEANKDQGLAVSSQK